MLLIMVILAILASLAWPAYREQVMKTRRSTGLSALLDLATRLEHYYADHNTYTGAILGANTGSIYPAASRSGDYRLAINIQNDLYYKISATPTVRRKQDRDRCGTFTLDSLGSRGLSGNAIDIRQCWQ
jgi:type IV pilus assembly protein PilE